MMKKNDQILCNCCGKELDREGGRYVDHLHIAKSWGYLSAQDGTVEEMDICPECLEKWKRTFAIAPQCHPQTELL
ncbi:hypothetical protein AALB53_01730 [Lachnospiraceae bacterium 47-T17]